MESVPKQRAYQVLALALVAGAIWATISIVREVFGLNKDQLALVGALAVAAASYFGTRSIERRKVMEAAIRQKKTDLYEEFTSFMFELFLSGKNSSEEEMTEFFSRMTPRLIAYASNSVIKEWGEFRNIAKGDPMRALGQFEKLLKAIRADLGLRSVFLQDKALLRLFVNDLDDLFGSAK